MAYILTTIALWVNLFLLVPFNEWRKYYPTIIFAALLGTVSDLFGVVFKQWVYYGPVIGNLSLWSDLGIAPAEGGIFIRLYPKSKDRLYKFIYLMLWTVGNAFFEWFFVRVGWIGYNHWNPFRAWLFYVFFFGLVWLQEYWYNGTKRLKRQTDSGEIDG